MLTKIITFSAKEWFLAGVPLMLNLIKSSFFFFWGGGLLLAKIINYGLDPHISDAKIDPIIPFSVFESHRYSNNNKKITGKVKSCV